ncbi:MAG: hypothetical protein LC114_00675 [Bryobacterales bacterium]|nr:hypothetical protein [Bryobacterales bacterium]
MRAGSSGGTSTWASTRAAAAFKIMYDYHLSRAVGPIIPTGIWKIRKDELNQTWKEHRNGTVTT